jgi:glycerol-3-phosphate cytidylyltransferase-like family protein
MYFEQKRYPIKTKTVNEILNKLKQHSKRKPIDEGVLLKKFQQDLEYIQCHWHKVMVRTFDRYFAEEDLESSLKTPSKQRLDNEDEEVNLSELYTYKTTKKTQRVVNAELSNRFNRYIL